VKLASRLSSEPDEFHGEDPWSAWDDLVPLFDIPRDARESGLAAPAVKGVRAGLSDADSGPRSRRYRKESGATRKLYGMDDP